MIVPTRFPGPSFFAICSAANTLAPPLDPAITPSFRANSLTVSKRIRIADGDDLVRQLRVERLRE